MWCDRVMTEFYQQGDRERSAGLMVTPIFDRENPIPRPKLQAGFIQGVCKPLYLALAEVPGMSIGPCVAQLEQNLATWTKMLENNLINPPSDTAETSKVQEEHSTETPASSTDKAIVNATSNSNDNDDDDDDDDDANDDHDDTNADAKSGQH